MQEQASEGDSSASHCATVGSPPPPNVTIYIDPWMPREPPQKKPREDDTDAPPERILKRRRISVIPAEETINEARIKFWSENQTWPTDKQEETLDRFRDLVNYAHARKKSLSRKRSNASLTSDTTPTYITGSMLRDKKYAPYKHPLFEHQLNEGGSFMDEHKLGITAESGRLCQQLLLHVPQAVPHHTLFSDDDLFNKTYKRMKSENDTIVIQKFSQLIIPSAEELAA